MPIRKREQTFVRNHDRRRKIIGRRVTQEQIDRILSMKDTHTARQIAESLGWGTATYTVKKVIAARMLLPEELREPLPMYPEEPLFDWKDYDNDIFIGKSGNGHIQPF